MHVLIVEDDLALGHFLSQGLKLDGHQVALAADGEEALAYAAKLHPELMILDLGLPRKDGIAVLEEMAEHYSSTSVLVLTARAISKPSVFSKIILSRVRAVCDNGAW